MSIFLSRDIKVLGQGITGAEGSKAARWAKDYGTNIVAGVTPGKGGQEIEGVPIFNSIKEAIEKVGTVDVAVSFVPPRFAKDAFFEAAGNDIKFSIIIAEKVPTKDAALMYAYAQEKGVKFLGPNTAGAISPIRKIKLGLMGGPDPTKMFIPGEVAIVSKSGSIAAEIGLTLKRANLGVSWAIGIGGDRIIGQDFVDCLKTLEEDPYTKVSVLFGELGGVYEELAAKLINEGLVKKPVVAFIAGEFTLMLPSEVQFGHAGAIIEGDRGKPDYKRRVLAGAGVKIAQKIEDIPDLVKELLNG